MYFHCSASERDTAAYVISVSTFTDRFFLYSAISYVRKQQGSQPTWRVQRRFQLITTNTMTKNLKSISPIYLFFKLHLMGIDKDLFNVDLN